MGYWVFNKIWVKYLKQTKIEMVISYDLYYYMCYKNIYDIIILKFCIIYFNNKTLVNINPNNKNKS
jgi:hypothetical protein